MRICIDIQAAVAQRAGIGRYTQQLVTHLGAFAASDEVSLFFFDFRRRGLTFAAPHAIQRACRWCPGSLVQQGWKRIDWPPFDWLAGPADLYHFPNFVIPPVTRGRKVVTVHDMSFVRFPEFAEEKNLRYLTAAIARTVARADAVITLSRHSAAEIETFLKVSPDRIFPVYLGVPAGYARPPAGELAAVRQRYGLSRPYLLTVGTLEPRKNLPFLIDVFEHLDDFDGDLVIAGMHGWKFGPILERMRMSARSARIRYLEYVDDEALPALYAAADLFMLTSFYEGFGLPPLEAMACGTPVISSTGGALDEIVGPAAVTVPGFDRAAWVDAVDGVLRSPSRRAGLVEAGLRHAAAFSWRETARQTFDVYRKVAG